MASLGIKVTQDGVKQAEDGLEKMAAAGDKAAASQDRLSEANARAGKSSNSASIRAQREELSKLIGTIDPVVAKLGQLDEQERKLSQFRAKGLIGDDDFKVYADKIEASRLALSRYADTSGKTALSQKALAAANRGIPAQFTDIATSIAGGQRPLSVLLQQGGQLKDMFGGIGPAARALGGYVLGLINPFTLLAGASIALAVAWKQGSDEAVAFNQALARTGNYAGVTASQLQDQARSISASAGTQHEAAAALAEVAGSGKFTADQIALVGKAAVDMARLTGQSTAETIRQFSDLKNEPVKAVLALNDAEHFLTTALYEQIKALQDSGREDEAATVAMKARADAVAERAKSVEQSAGLMERAWTSVASAAKKAWDAMLDVGRPDTSAEQIAKIQERMQAVRDRSGPMFADLTDRQQASILATYQKSLDQLQEKERQADQEASKKSIAAQAVQAVADSDREVEIYATREQKRVREIAAAHGRANEQVERALAAGDKASAERIRSNEAKIVAGINEKYKAPKTPKSPEISALATFKQQVDALQVKNVVGDSTALTEYQQGIARLANEMSVYMSKGGDATKAAAEFNRGQQALQKTLDLNHAKEAAANEQYALALDRRNEALRDSITAEVQRIGMGSQEYERSQKISQQYRQEANALADLALKRQMAVNGLSGGISQEQYEFDAGKIRASTAEAVKIIKDGYAQMDSSRKDWRNGVSSGYADILSDAGNVAGQTRSLFVNSFDSIADSLTNFVTKGKLDFKGLVSSILTDLARMEIRILASKALQAIFGSFDGTGGATSVAANAKGGVYDSPSLAKYSNQVVSEPTFFKFAKGGALGLMGEVPGKSEAIMPLSRGANGELGVTVHGGSAGGVVINIDVTVNSDGTSQVETSGDNRAFGKQFGDAMANAARQVVAQEIRPGGQIYTALSRK
nr:phage tail tape measure protein [Luteibacter yeojuensis]